MHRYQADLSAGALLLAESRIVARLMCSGADQASFDRAIGQDNLLQKSSPATAARHARLIRSRLLTLGEAAWTHIAQGDKETATQLLFAATLKRSNLLSDFLRRVVADHVRRLEPALAPRAWEPFLAECGAREPQVESWSASTRHKLFQVIVRILAEARYLESTRSLRLLPPHINPTVHQILASMGEDRLLQTMELCA